MQNKASARRARRTHNPTFEAQVALAALREDRPTAERCAQFRRHLNQIGEGTKPLLECATEVFAGGASPEPVNLAPWHAKPVLNEAEGIRSLALMRRCNGLHLECPFLEGRRLRRGSEALTPPPGTNKRAPGHKGHRYLLRKLAITRAKPVRALDTTDIPMARGYVYLTAAVVDVASRCILAQKVAIPLEAVHARQVIEQAFARYGRPEIVNTDHGSQFTAIEFIATVRARGCKLSMGGRLAEQRL